MLPIDFGKRYCGGGLLEYSSHLVMSPSDHGSAEAADVAAVAEEGDAAEVNRICAGLHFDHWCSGVVALVRESAENFHHMHPIHVA